MMKELAIETTNVLPDTTIFDDIIEAIYIRLKIEKGIESSKIDKALTTEDWIKEIEKRRIKYDTIIFYKKQTKK